MPPRALDPAGVALVDKPAGPSSFAVVSQIRRLTGARTGHAGTLDPFATGLLLLLSGRATKLTPQLVGLDKRYVTEVDLRARTSTGDPEGEIVETLEPPDEAELERLAALRGEIELPIPAASAVKIGGERAYRLARRGVVVEMPLRRSTVYALDVVAYTGDTVTLDMRVGSGTYVRAIAHALGGHCTTLRRTAVGPFDVRDAVTPDAFEPSVLLPRPMCSPLARSRSRVIVVRHIDDLEPAERAVAIGTFDGVHVGHRAVIEQARVPGLRQTVVTFDPHPRFVLGARVEVLATVERRLELLEELGVDEVVVLHFDEALAALDAESFAESVFRRRRARGWWRPARTSSSARDAGGTWTCSSIWASRCAAYRSWRVSRRPGSARCSAPARSSKRPRCSAGRPRSRGRSSPATSAATRSASRRRTSRCRRTCSCPSSGSTPGRRSVTAPPSRSARTRTTAAPSGAIEAFLLDYEGDLYGQRLVVELWERLRDEAAFESEAALVDAIASDVERTRAARRPG